MAIVLQAILTLNVGVTAMCVVSVAQGRQPVLSALVGALNALAVVGMALTLRTVSRNQW